MSEIFKCKMCGECCRNMRGRTVQKLLPRLPPFVFVAVPLSMQTIGIQEWEIPALNASAKELSIELHIKPSVIFWDEISGTPIATQWNLDHDDCPFLTNQNTCAVHESKPLICQAYPLFFLGIFTREPKEPKILELGDCPNVVDLPFAEGAVKIEDLCFSKSFSASMERASWVCSVWIAPQPFGESYCTTLRQKNSFVLQSWTTRLERLFSEASL